MNDQFWQSLPREDCGIRRINGASWMLFFGAGAVIGIAWLIWHFV